MDDDNYRDPADGIQGIQAPDAPRVEMGAVAIAEPPENPDDLATWPPRRSTSREVGTDLTWWLSAYKLTLLIVVGVLVLGGLGTAVLLGRAKSTPKVTLYTVQSASLHTFVGGGGLTYPVQSLNIVYPVSARVTQVSVQVGQSVVAGQTLITLDSAALDRVLQDSYSRWQNAQSYLNTLTTQAVPAAQLAAAEQAVANAKAAYDSLNALLNSPTYRNGKILAPFAGVVTAVNVSADSITSTAATLVTLEDVSNIIVKAQFPLEQRSLVTVGASAQIYPAATPDQAVTGKIATINPVLSSAGSSTFEAWVNVPNTDLRLFSSESVYVRVQTQQQLPTVPELAVVNPDADSIAFVYSNGRAHLRHVVVGVRDGDQFGISNGLQPGDQVILVGQYQLTDNERVTVTRTEP